MTTREPTPDLDAVAREFFNDENVSAIIDYLVGQRGGASAPAPFTTVLPG